MLDTIAPEVHIDHQGINPKAQWRFALGTPLTSNAV